VGKGISRKKKKRRKRGRKERDSWKACSIVFSNLKVFGLSMVAAKGEGKREEKTHGKAETRKMPHLKRAAVGVYPHQRLFHTSSDRGSVSARQLGREEGGKGERGPASFSRRDYPSLGLERRTREGREKKKKSPG